MADYQSDPAWMFAKTFFVFSKMKEEDNVLDWIRLKDYALVTGYCMNPTITDFSTVSNKAICSGKRSSNP